jgi:hypothetical protein
LVSNPKSISPFNETTLLPKSLMRYSII